MKYIMVALGALLLSLIIFLVSRSIRGHRIAAHLLKFEGVYDDTYSETKSKELSLRNAMSVFRTCPILKQLTDSEHNRIVEILKESLDPKKVVDTIVLRMDSQKSLSAFRNDEFLNKMASAGKEQRT